MTAIYEDVYGTGFDRLADSEADLNPAGTIMNALSGQLVAACVDCEELIPGIASELGHWLNEGRVALDGALQGVRDRLSAEHNANHPNKLALLSIGRQQSAFQSA